MASFGTVTGSDLIAKSLEIEGVDTVFTLAGDHILPTLDCMSDRGFRFIDTRHEQAAAHMADAWGRITGRPGVAMYTTPGFANAMPGLANAMHSGSPLLSISGSAELHELGRGAMQEIDQVGMARPVTKSAWMVTDARRIPDMIATALRVAYEGRRGPVHLTIPVDIQQQEVGEAEVSLFRPGEYRDQGTSPTSLEKVRDAVAILREAERPLVIVGSAGAYWGSGEGLQELVETARLPFMTEGDARGLVPDTHPYCYGFFDSGLNRAARLLREADAVVLMGRKQDLIVGYALPPTISPGAQVIQIDPSAAEVARNRGVAVGIAGGVEAATRQMADEALKYAWDDHAEWRARLEAERSAQAESLDALARHESPMHAMYVHKAIRNHIRDDDFVVYDGGDFCHFGRASTPALSPRTWLYLPTSGMLGQSLPTALAAKARVSEPAGVHVHGRWSVRVQRDGVRHGRQAQPADYRHNGQRLGMGDRQADTGRRLWQAGRDRPAAVALRPGRQGPGRLWGVGGAPGRARLCRRAGDKAGPTFAAERAYPERHQPARRDRHRTMEESRAAPDVK